MTRQQVVIGVLAGVLGCVAQAAPPQPVVLGSVRLTVAVLADGKPLKPGLYQIRLTNDEPVPATGQSPHSERWVEFFQGEVNAGRELATVVSSEDIGKIAKGPQPQPNTARVDRLTGGDYVRIWIASGGNHYLIHLPVRSGATGVLFRGSYSPLPLN